MRIRTLSFLVSVTALVSACAHQPTVSADRERDQTLILALANHPALDERTLHELAGLDRQAAASILAHRAGPDGVFNSSDDGQFESFQALDSLEFVSAHVLDKLLEFAERLTRADPIRIRQILRVVNDDALSVDMLVSQVGLSREAAQAIVDVRAGADRTLGTEDDRLYRTLDDLDAVAHVSRATIDRIADFGGPEGPSVATMWTCPPGKACYVRTSTN